MSVLPLSTIELAIQKKKINEVFAWFQEHFLQTSHAQYIQRCPLLIFQGPTGCGKTATLAWIAKELKVSIKEYSETTDLTAISSELARALRGDIENHENSSLSQSIDRKKALKFEHFIVNSLRYNTLYSAEHKSRAIDIPIDSDAEAEFDDEDDIFFSNSMPPKGSQADTVNGVIIHIETPLTFARNQRILIQSLYKLIKVIRDISRNVSRRLAIVFETLEGDSSIISLPTKLKGSLGIQTFKFNPVTKANMKKLIEHAIKQYKNVYIDKETIEQIVNDCDGDIRACLNTIHLICNRPQLSSDTTNLRTGILNQHNGINNNYSHIIIKPDRHKDLHYNTSPYCLQASKKQKLNHDDGKTKQIKLTANLLRDNTRSASFFHVLGKIFYQKRIYPDRSNQLSNQLRTNQPIYEFERPYPTVNTTEEIVDMLDIEAKNLLSWLHQHYHKFCNDQKIEKAALFLENLSTVDTISLASTQSTQFYEAQSSIDKLQLHLAIESTVFSLYEDQFQATPKSSHKKIVKANSTHWIKSSVECSTSSLRIGDDSCSFKKPVAKSLERVVGDYSLLLEMSSNRMFDLYTHRIDSDKLLVDYIPYLNHIFNNWSSMPPSGRQQFRSKGSNTNILDDCNLTNLFKTFNKFESCDEVDYDAKHDQLLEFIEEIEIQQKGISSIKKDKSQEATLMN